MADEHSVEPYSAPARGAADGGGLTPDAWTLLETLPVPMAVNELGGDGAVRFVNTAFVETFGYTLDDVPTTAAWAERAYPDPAYRAEVMGQWFAEIEGLRGTGGVGAPKEYRLFDKAGRMRQARIGFTLSGDLSIVTLQDLTDVRAAESALEAERRKNERTAYALTENMPAGAYTMVLAPGEEMAKFSFVSTRFLDMLDLNKEATVADPMAGFACVHPDDRPNWVALNAEAFAARRPFSEETRVVVRGETRWIRAESVPRVLEDGSIVWEGILVDITRLKETEQHLKDVLVAADAYAWRRDVRKRRIENEWRWRELVGLPTTESDVADDIWMKQVHPDEVGTVPRAVAARASLSRRNAAVAGRRLDCAGQEQSCVPGPRGSQERPEGRPCGLRDSTRPDPPGAARGRAGLP